MKKFLEEYKNIELLKASQLYTRHHAKTFYFASFMLTKEKREAAYVIYSFCRYADDVLDSNNHESLENKKNHLNKLKQILEKTYANQLEENSPFKAFQLITQQYKIPKQHFLDLLEGIAMDLTINRYETWSDLELYCYRVASVVGLMMCHIFGVESEKALPYAVSMGKAMQMTNILRDINEDYLMNRVYLPQEDLRKFACSEESLKSKQVDNSFIELMKFQIDRARDFYREADLGIPMITDRKARFCARVMGGLYERILDQIQKKQYDVFKQRVYVPLWQKILYLIKLRLS